jgi:hypothetical protein
MMGDTSLITRLVEFLSTFIRDVEESDMKGASEADQRDWYVPYIAGLMAALDFAEMAQRGEL